MSQSFVLDITEKAMLLVLILSLPPICVATILGLIVSLGQALTQVQEQTLGFAIKLVGVIVAIVFFGGWMVAELIQFASELFYEFHTLVP